jgi:hypothetical protein
MDPCSGAIATFETTEDAEQAGYTVPLTQEQFKQFSGMNRRQRLAALAQQRREAKRKK